VLLDRDWIAAHIPHQGAMCLLDAVTSWDGDNLRGIASSHRSGDNPLRAHGRLGAACGIEYAAQAMAIHGALTAPQGAASRGGYLASVRTTTLHVDRLDDIPGDLTIEVRRFGGDDNTVLYDFLVHANGRALVEGRASAVLDAAGLHRSLPAAEHAATKEDRK
jgi:predicted hotdog family 3-hydroxylacyl-ACP dehydratase